ncbi:MAG: hypothetical protein ACRC7O_10650 [Fimbriiglobus sp.]
MFPYADPAGRNFLGRNDVQAEFRQRRQGIYDTFARRPNSGFTWIEAFDSLGGGQPPLTPNVPWFAFPLTATGTLAQIDADRLQFQDEYVEWRAEVKDSKLARVIFTTEFPEYFEAFAAIGEAALIAAIQDAIPDADPTTAELFGPGFNPGAASAIARAQRFTRRLSQNPWNNGQKGILCLMQQSNTLGALFNLLAACGVPRANGTPQDTCGLVGGACGPGRSSDPNVCAAAQQAVRDGFGFTLRDPGGVRIVTLQGVWKVGNTVIDVNDEATNQGVWKVSRNGRRGVLTVVPGLKLDEEAVATGAQVSKKLRVTADLLAAPNAALPDWARIGAESGSRGPTA